MNNPPANVNDRNAIITRFIIIYIICIACCFVPLYLLFDIPGHAIKSLNASKYSVKEQKKQLGMYMGLMATVDSCLPVCEQDKKVFHIGKLYKFAKEDVSDDNLYKGLFLKTHDLYEKILKYSELSNLKSDYDKLKADYDKLESEKKQADKDLDACNKEMMKLLMKK